MMLMLELMPIIMIIIGPAAVHTHHSSAMAATGQGRRESVSTCWHG